ncbi:hypothetical protein N656DRAFT_784078 [Canariomyces notabilis]|uniref:Uncharacterized protein n=1 Tax=Canariomyces notabilis TaxID=2074819 RepID=A0AAN6QE58_9PEZI|nr:hypothetical protein N656DRAFT_784078 [Canariomyces arenarius]
MHKLGTKPINRPSDLDNQIATYLNIDPESGFAPMEWQAGRIGTVVVGAQGPQAAACASSGGGVDVL